MRLPFKFRYQDIEKSLGGSLSNELEPDSQIYNAYPNLIIKPGFIFEIVLFSNEGRSDSFVCELNLKGEIGIKNEIDSEVKYSKVHSSDSLVLSYDEKDEDADIVCENGYFDFSGVVLASLYALIPSKGASLLNGKDKKDLYGVEIISEKEYLKRQEENEASDEDSPFAILKKLKIDE